MLAVDLGILKRVRIQQQDIRVGDIRLRLCVTRSKYVLLFLLAILSPAGLRHFVPIWTNNLYLVAYITGASSMFAGQWDTRLRSCRDPRIIRFHP